MHYKATKPGTRGFYPKICGAHSPHRCGCGHKRLPLPQWTTKRSALLLIVCVVYYLYKTMNSLKSFFQSACSDTGAKLKCIVHIVLCPPRQTAAHPFFEGEYGSLLHRPNLPPLLSPFSFLVFLATGALKIDSTKY